MKSILFLLAILISSFCYSQDNLSKISNPGNVVFGRQDSAATKIAAYTVNGIDILVVLDSALTIKILFDRNKYLVDRNKHLENEIRRVWELHDKKVYLKPRNKKQ